MSDSEESVDLGDVRTQLSRKIEQVLGWYKVHFNIKNASKSTTDCRNLFDSMVRWHKNSHISEKSWMESFEAISWKLNLENKMEVDSRLKEFIYKKKKKTEHVERYTSPQLLEFLHLHIKALYLKLLEENEPEFSEKMVKMTGPELTFYLNFFEPSAFLYTYSDIHNDTPLPDLFEDLFTFGAGSKTKDFSPEVTAICKDCLKGVIDSPDSDASEVAENLNLKVFQLQMSHKFWNPSFWSGGEKIGYEDLKITDPGDDFINPFGKVADTAETDSSSKLSDYNYLKRMIDSESIDIDLFINPFVVSETTSRISKELDCESCGLKFSEEEYLTFHKEVFHKVTDIDEGGHQGFKKTPLKLNFVDEGEDLMKTFCFEERSQLRENSREVEERESSGIKVKEKSPIRKRSRKVLKYPC